MFNRPAYETLLSRIEELEKKHAERKRSEEELRRRLKLEKMVSDISTHAVSAGQVSEFKQDCLDIMGETLDVSRIYIFEHRHRTDTMDNTHEWVAPGINPQKIQLQGLPATVFPWWIEMMKNNRIINYENIEDIPEEKEREILRQQDIKSILVVPLFVQKSYYGFMGFDECRKHRRWLDEDINILRTISEIIRGTIERLKTATELAAEREQLLSIFGSINQIIYVTDPSTYEVLYVNDTLKEMYNKKLIGSLCFQAFQGLGAPCDFCTNPIIMQHKYKPYQWEYHNPLLNRSYMIVDRIIRWPDGRDVRFEIATDITDRKKAETALKESEEKYRQLFEMESDAIFLIHNDTGNILEVNAAAEALYGFSRREFLQLKNTQLSAEPEQTHKATSDRLTQVPIRYHRKKNGTVFPVEITARHFLWKGETVHVAAIRDITFRLEAEKEKGRLEFELLQAQKMESIGTLAGGIAHDFNNLLMGIQGYSSLMLADYDPSHPHHRSLKKIERLAKSGSRLTSQLLGFARKGKYEVKPIDLNRLARDAADTIGRTRKDITFLLELSEGLCAVEADRGQMEQVFLNLYINAADAMPNGGKITVQTSTPAHRDIPDTVLHPRPGNYVRLTVSDTGIGMDRETLKHIFDPFFTTKEMGRGTGLGLSSVYGIIQSHSGHIEVVSEKNRGTTFSIYLPCTDNPVQESEVLAESMIMGKETILIVDDEPMVLDIGVELLKRLGYNVLEAGSGRQAIEIYQTRKDSIDLVILDMIMPEQGGGEIWETLRAINPDVRVLLSSGYSMEGKASELLNRGCSGFIQKPFSIQKLSARIKEILALSKT
jgi:PAS domain S-box-containing protein